MMHVFNAVSFENSDDVISYFTFSQHKLHGACCQREVIYYLFLLNFYLYHNLYMYRTSATFRLVSSKVFRDKRLELYVRLDLKAGEIDLS